MGSPPRERIAYYLKNVKLNTRGYDDRNGKILSSRFDEGN